MARLGKSAVLFVAIGLAVYAGVYTAAELLVYRAGKSNPFYKIATAEPASFDWVILGASHAMPLDFADFNAFMERETGRRILNLASPGTGPLYNRFVLEHLLGRRRVDNLLYVVDSFAFYSAAWNEDRFADAKLLGRTPFDVAIAWRLLNYSCREGVAARAVLDYVTGFSKINNRERFERDVWEGEKQFDRVYRPSSTAVQKRVAYLYPEPPGPAALSRYLGEFEALVALARQRGMRVTVIKLPLPPAFLGKLPEEAQFDAALAKLLADQQVAFHDFAGAMGEPRHYFDTDHLNRPGLTEFFTRHLKAILASSPR
jgi:hypothetical protein